MNRREFLAVTTAHLSSLTIIDVAADESRTYQIAEICKLLDVHPSEIEGLASNGKLVEGVCADFVKSILEPTSRLAGDAATRAFLARSGEPADPSNPEEPTHFLEFDMAELLPPHR